MDALSEAKKLEAEFDDLQKEDWDNTVQSTSQSITLTASYLRHNNPQAFISF